MRSLKQSCIAVSDTGETFIIDVFEEFEAGGASETRWTPTQADLRTRDGRSVMHIGKGVYQVKTPTGTVCVTSHDPGAP